jgi:hypothetical protein
MTKQSAQIITHTPFNEYEGCFSSGLEDIRLYSNGTFTANSISLGNGKVPQIVYGRIDPLRGNVVELQHIASPRSEYECEKNWIFIDDGCATTITTTTPPRVIYRFNPYEMGTLSRDTVTNKHKLQIEHTCQLTPTYMFKNMRGSTPFIPYTMNGDATTEWLIGVVHYSIDQTRDTPMVRKYYHCLLLLDPVTLIPKRMTHPFLFGTTHGIEFCIGFKYDAGHFTFWVSVMDAVPQEFTIAENKLRFAIDVGIL